MSFVIAVCARWGGGVGVYDRRVGWFVDSTIDHGSVRTAVVHLTTTNRNFERKINDKTIASQFNRCYIL